MYVLTASIYYQGLKWKKGVVDWDDTLSKTVKRLASSPDSVWAQPALTHHCQLPSLGLETNSLIQSPPSLHHPKSTGDAF